MQVTEVAWDEESDDLPGTVGKHFVPCGLSLQNEVEKVGDFSFADEVASGLHSAHVPAELVDLAPLLTVQVCDIEQLSHQHIHS